MPMAVGAQWLAPSPITLPDNQRLLGHYTTDSLATTGWGRASLEGTCTVAIDLTTDELAAFQHGKIVAMRVGLAEATPISRVFVIPIDSKKQLGQTVEWSCDASDQGWNVIELNDPYLINLPDGYSLRVGFDYEQSATNKPVSAVKVGTVYSILHFMSNGNWGSYISRSKGNLSLQCIVEKDKFEDYVIKPRNLTIPGFVLHGATEFTINFEVANFGLEASFDGEVTFAVAIDGTQVGTFTQALSLTSAYVPVTASIPLTLDLAQGIHTVTLTPVAVNGETVNEPLTTEGALSYLKKAFDRQMHLAEQFTSTECMWCPLGSKSLKSLCELRNDVAWVGIHGILYDYDPFNTAQCDSLMYFEGANAYPMGAFDRTTGIESANSIIGGLTYDNPAEGAAYFNSFLEYVEQSPAWATVNINSTFDADSRKAVVTIDGELAEGYEDFMGSDSKLTVYLTEDSLVATQIDQDTYVTDYVHNGVMRQALGSAMGVALKRQGDSYKNVFTVNIPEDWKTENMNIVAFISRPLGNAYTDIYVTNTNKRKLGEADAPATLLGDVNGDGKRDVADVSILINAVLKGTPLDLSVADINGDGKLDVADVALLINIVLNS